MEIVVSPKLNKTVLRRPIYPIKTPVGKEHTANQKKYHNRQHISQCIV